MGCYPETPVSALGSVLLIDAWFISVLNCHTRGWGEKYWAIIVAKWFANMCGELCYCISVCVQLYLNPCARNPIWKCVEKTRAFSPVHDATATWRYVGCIEAQCEQSGTDKYPHTHTHTLADLCHSRRVAKVTCKKTVNWESVWVVTVDFSVFPAPWTKC